MADTPNLARKVLARLRRAPSRPAVVYRDGVPNRADEIVQADTVAQQLMAAGVLEMGAYSYFAPSVRMFAGDSAKVRVGRYSSVAQGVTVYPGGAHRTDWVTTYGLRIVFGLEGAFEDGTPASAGDVEIGNDVWIAADSTILSGVRIGDGAVVATGSVVTKDVRPYAVVGGNPARELRRRFPDDQVDALLRIAWWSWPVEEVLEHVAALCSDDISAFIDRFDPGPG